MHRKVLAAAASVAFFGASRASMADSYASGFTAGAGTIGFYLNEAASSVFLQQGAGSIALATTKGLQTSSVADGSFSVVVNELGNSGYLLGTGAGTNISQVSNATTTYSVSYLPTARSIINSPITSTNLDFANVRGVAVNQDPTSANFGTIYVSNGTLGTDATTANGTNRRTTNKGIYIVNPDGTDKYGQGTTAFTASLPLMQPLPAPSVRAKLKSEKTETSISLTTQP